MAKDLDQVRTALSDTSTADEVQDAMNKLAQLQSNNAVEVGRDVNGSVVIAGSNNNASLTINHGTSAKELIQWLHEKITEAEKANQRPVLCKTRSMLLTSVGIGVLVGIARFLAGLQGLELWALDGLMATQAPFAQEDNRILVIAPNDEEVEQQRQGAHGQEIDEKGASFTDDKLADVLEKIQKYHPVVIGLDLQRPYAAKGRLAQILNPSAVAPPVQPLAVRTSKSSVKQQQTLNVKQRQTLKLKRQKTAVTITPPLPATVPAKVEPLNLIGGCKAIETKADSNGKPQAMKGTEIAPPIEIAKAHPEQIGFVDFVIGVGRREVLRRQILAQEIPPLADTCKTTVAFSLRLASQLLFKEYGYTNFDTKPQDKQCPQFIHSDSSKNFSFPYFNAVTGGFQGGTEENDRYGGCQMLLNYGVKTINTITLTQLLKDGELDRLEPKPKIILIGSAAHTHNDYWLTPLGEQQGAVIQALTVSQTIDTVLRKQRLIWALPEGIDFFWVMGWSLLGGVLGWRLRFWKPWLLSLSTAVIILYLGCGLSFWLLQLWLPLIPPLITALASASSVAYLNFRLKFGTGNPFEILRKALIESK